MCGLYGIFGNGILQNDLRAFNYLAFLNQLRGTDATGVLRVFREGWGAKKTFRTEIKKDTCSAQEFFDKDENLSILTQVTPVAIMGHNRWATVGDKTDIRGAHPFENDKLVGFHNGTLKEDKYNKDRKFFTDSEGLYADIAEFGLKETLEPLEKKSAFALAYWNKETNYLTFVRNDERTLWFATNLHRNVVYYSSERSMLEWALHRADIKFQVYSCTPWHVLETTPDDFKFTKRDEGRVNTWFIDELKPNPPAPPPPPKVQSLPDLVQSVFHRGYPPSNQARTFNTDVIKCVVCHQETAYATSVNKRAVEDNPTYVSNVGYHCRECMDERLDYIADQKRRLAEDTTNVSVH